jgi:hypothetical protein
MGRPSITRHHGHRNGLSGDLSSEAGSQRHARFALMQDEHRPCALTNDEVTLPMAALGSAVDSLGLFVEDTRFLRGAYEARSAWPAAFAATRETTPVPKIYDACVKRLSAPQ